MEYRNANHIKIGAHVRTCGVLTTEQRNVETAEEKKSKVGFKIFFGTFWQYFDSDVILSNCCFVV